MSSLWIPVWNNCDRTNLTYASQMVLMLELFGVVSNAARDDEDYFVFTENEAHRRLSADEVISELGDKLSAMIDRIMVESELTTTQSSVPDAPARSERVPWLPFDDRSTEFPRFWPSQN